MLFPSIKRTKSFLNPEDILRQAGIKENDIVAELGCGSGHFVFEASKMIGDKGIVYAVDIQKSILSEIRSKIKIWGRRNVRPVWADLEVIGSTKILDNSVDLAVLSSTLHQVKNRKNVFMEAKRILKEEGKLIILDWKKESTPFGPDISLRIDGEQLKKEVEALGFKFVKDITTDSYHYGFLAEK